MLCDLVPGGFGMEITAGQPADLLQRICPSASAAGNGKSDPIDAHLAVLAALRLDADRPPVPRSGGDRQALRILLIAYQEITEASTAQAGRLARERWPGSRSGPAILR